MKVDIPPRLIHGNNVESETSETALCRGLVEAVPARIVGNDSAVFCGTQIVAPRTGSIGPLNNILLVVIVEISELHWEILGENSFHWIGLLG
jgi:hypothetical protein